MTLDTRSAFAHPIGSFSLFLRANCRARSLRTLVFMVFDRMSLREQALVKDTGDKNPSAFFAVKYDVLSVFKTMQSRSDFITGPPQGRTVG